MKILLKILYWVVVPYIGIGILVGKVIKNKFDNNFIGVLSGVFVGLIVFCIWMSIFGPSDEAEVEVKKVEVLDSKTTTEPEKETLADKMYKELKPQELKITNSEAITILQNNNEILKQIKIEKQDNLKKSWVRWATTFELKDKSKIKVYWEKDKNLFTKVEVVKKNSKDKRY